MGKYNKDLERSRSKSKNSNCNRSRIGYLIRNLWIALTISSCTVIAGCQSLKESTVVATGSAIGAGVGTAISGGVGAPILGAMTGAFVTDVATEVLKQTKRLRLLSMRLIISLHSRKNSGDRWLMAENKRAGALNNVGDFLGAKDTAQRATLGENYGFYF